MSFEELAGGVTGDAMGRLRLRLALFELSELLPFEAALAQPRGAASVHALLQSVGPDVLTQLAQAFASHEPDPDGKLRGSSLQGFVASLTEGRVGGGLGLVPRNELKRVVLLPSVALTHRGVPGGEAEVEPEPEPEPEREPAGLELGAAAMRQGVAFLEAAPRLARLLRRQGPVGRRLPWERYCELLRHVSSQARHSVQASLDEWEESAALCRTFDVLERGALRLPEFRKAMALLDEQHGWIHSVIQVAPP